MFKFEFAISYLYHREGIWAICSGASPHPRLKLLDRAHLAILLVRSKFADRAGQSLAWSGDQGYHGWWNITVWPVAAAPKIAPNLPKVQGLITRPEKPRYLTNTNISFLFVLNPTICFYLCFFYICTLFYNARGWGWVYLFKLILFHSVTFHHCSSHFSAAKQHWRTGHIIWSGQI